MADGTQDDWMWGSDDFDDPVAVVDDVDFTPPGYDPDPVIPDYGADDPVNSDWAQGPVNYGNAPLPGLGLPMDKLGQLTGGNLQFQQDFNTLISAYGNLTPAQQADMGKLGLAIDATGKAVLTNLDNGQTVQPGTDLWKTAQGLMKPLGDFMNSGLGQAALRAGLGLGASALAGAIAGGAPSFQVPGAAPLPTPPTPGAYPTTPAYNTPVAGSPGQFQTPTAAAAPTMSAPTVGGVPAPPPTPSLSQLPAAPGYATASSGPAASAVAPTGVGQLQMNTIAQDAATAALKNGGAADIQRSIGGALEGQGTLGEFLADQSHLIKQDQQDNAGAARQIRMDAYGNLLDAMGNPVPLEDAIQAGLSDEIMNVLGGQYSNPQLEDQMQQDEQTFQQKMLNQLGPGWETSTAGIQARKAQDIKQAAIREDDKKRTVANYATLEQQRRQFNITNPQAYQQQNINQQKGLLGTGLSSEAADNLAKNLNTIAPIGGFINQQGADAAAARQDNANLSTTLGNLQASTAANNTAAQVSMANASYANAAQMAAYQAAVAQGAREDQAIIAGNQAYYQAMINSGARQDDYNMRAADNNFAAQRDAANFTNNAGLTGATANFNAQNAQLGRQDQFNATAADRNWQAGQTAAAGNFGAQQRANDQQWQASMAGYNFTNQSNLAGAQANFNQGNAAAQSAAKGVGAAIGTLAGQLPGAAQPRQTTTIATY